MESGQVSYRPRDLMEEDPSFKQLIPYVVFEHRDADEERHVGALGRLGNCLPVDRVAEHVDERRSGDEERKDVARQDVLGARHDRAA